MNWAQIAEFQRANLQALERGTPVAVLTQEKGIEEWHFCFSFQQDDDEAPNDLVLSLSPRIKHDSVIGIEAITRMELMSADRISALLNAAYMMGLLLK